MSNCAKRCRQAKRDKDGEPATGFSNKEVPDEHISGGTMRAKAHVD